MSIRVYQLPPWRLGISGNSDLIAAQDLIIPFIFNQTRKNGKTQTVLKTSWFAMGSTSNDDSLRNCFSTEASAMPLPAANSLRAKKHQETNPTLLYITWAQWAQWASPSISKFWKILSLLWSFPKSHGGTPVLMNFLCGKSHENHPAIGGLPIKKLHILRWIQPRSDLQGSQDATEP